MESLTASRVLIPAAPVNSPCPDQNTDAAILLAFEQWKALHLERDALPARASDRESDLWDKIDLLDTQVHDLPAKTSAGIACKLWIAITHNTPDANPEAAAFRADLDWFKAQGDSLDWNVRCIVSALVALKSMEG